MLYLLLIPAAVIAFHYLERQWKRFLTVNMRRQHDNLMQDIADGMDFAEANQEIVDFKYVWLDHPDCEMYVESLREALDEVEFQNNLGI